jgi:hypothetical protein
VVPAGYPRLVLADQLGERRGCIDEGKSVQELAIQPDVNL